MHAAAGGVVMGFRDEFDDTKDIIYGIGEWISRYILYFDEDTKYRGPIPADKWNKAHEKKATGFFAINTFNLAISGAQYRKLNDDVTTRLGTATGTVADALAADYVATLQKSPVYGPGSTTGKVAALAPKLRKSNVGVDVTNQQAVQGAARDLAIRRSSKFGIAYVVERLDGKVHYILDGVDMAVVLDKSTMTNRSTGIEKVPIVTSELRYLFRNWSRFKDTGKVLFWKNYAKVDPPWVSGSANELVGWATYALDRIQKHLAGLSADATWKTQVARLRLGDATVAQNLRANVGALKSADPAQRRTATTFLAQVDAQIKSPRGIITFFHSIPCALVNKEHTLPV